MSGSLPMMRTYYTQASSEKSASAKINACLGNSYRGGCMIYSAFWQAKIHYVWDVRLEKRLSARSIWFILIKWRISFATKITFKKEMRWLNKEKSMVKKIISSSQKSREWKSLGKYIRSQDWEKGQNNRQQAKVQTRSMNSGLRLHLREEIQEMITLWVSVYLMKELRDPVCFQAETITWWPWKEERSLMTYKMSSNPLSTIWYTTRQQRWDYLSYLSQIEINQSLMMPFHKLHPTSNISGRWNPIRSSWQRCCKVFCSLSLKSHLKT